MTNIERFLETQTEQKRREYERLILRLAEVGHTLDDIPGMTQKEMGELIVSMRPSSVKAISVYMNNIGNYLQFLGDTDAYERLYANDRKILLKKTREKYDLVCFLSYEEFKSFLYNIEANVEFNVEYITTLLQSVYEGIYSDDLSVLINLRGKDIHDGYVTLHNDTTEETYDLEVSKELCENLRYLAQNVTTWEQQNSLSDHPFVKEIVGKYPDSCFRIEFRGQGSNFKHAYYRQIRKITTEYYGTSIKPYYLFLSGMMERLRVMAEAEDASLHFMFVESPRSNLSDRLLREELERLHCTRKKDAIRSMVKGFIDVFE